MLLVEPLGTVLCHGPLTSLHRVLPTASVGYAIFDFIDGIRLGSLDFAAHGAVMFTFSTYIMEVDKNEILAVMLTFEVSLQTNGPVFVLDMTAYSLIEIYIYIYTSSVFYHFSQFDSSQVCTKDHNGRHVGICHHLLFLPSRFRSIRNLPAFLFVVYGGANQ